MFKRFWNSILSLVSRSLWIRIFEPSSFISKTELVIKAYIEKCSFVFVFVLFHIADMNEFMDEFSIIIIILKPQSYTYMDPTYFSVTILFCKYFVSFLIFLFTFPQVFFVQIWLGRLVRLDDSCIPSQILHDQLTKWNSLPRCTTISVHVERPQATSHVFTKTEKNLRKTMPQDVWCVLCVVPHVVWCVVCGVFASKPFSKTTFYLSVKHCSSSGKWLLLWVAVCDLNIIQL